MVSAVDNLALIVGAAAVPLWLQRLSWPARPSGLVVLAVLAVSVRAFPLVRSTASHEPRVSLSMIASTPLLGIVALYGAAWAVAAALVTTALDGVARAHGRPEPDALMRALARMALAVAAACAVFTLARGRTGELSLDVTLPALVASNVALMLSTWLLAAPRYAAAMDVPYARVAHESLFAALPAIAAEPVLALVLARAAMAPAPATLLAAVLPLAGLIVALRLHTDGSVRLERAHAALTDEHDRLRVQATTDPLTGLANRRHFDELLQARLAESRRYKRPLSVLLLDLDGFKGINDRYGHAAGDAVLIAVAEALRRSVRRSDVPARLGGDEFVAILPETTGSSALRLAERVCKEVAALRVPAGTATIQPSASVGAASTDGPGVLDPAGLLAAADDAAYAAKADGKNAARLAGQHAIRRLPARQRARIAR